MVSLLLSFATRSWFSVVSLLVILRHALGLVASLSAGHLRALRWFCYRVTLCLTLSCLGQFCASVTCSLCYLFCYAQGHGNLPTPLSRAEFFGYHAFQLKFYLTTVSLCAVLVCVISRVPPFFVCSPFLSSLHLVSPSVHCEPTQARGVCSQLVQSPKPISSCLCFGWSALWLQIGVSPLQEIEVGHDKQTVSQAAS